MTENHKDIQPASAPAGTTSILEQMDALEKAKKQRIKTLLQEREDRTKEHESRLDAIAAELKALGHHRTRAAKKQSADKAAAK